MFRRARAAPSAPEVERGSRNGALKAWFPRGVDEVTIGAPALRFKDGADARKLGVHAWELDAHNVDPGFNEVDVGKEHDVNADRALESSDHEVARSHKVFLRTFPTEQFSALVRGECHRHGKAHIDKINVKINSNFQEAGNANGARDNETGTNAGFDAKEE